jgi:hypothetical protein
VTDDKPQWGVWCFEFNDWMRGRVESSGRKPMAYALERDAKAFIRKHGLSGQCEARPIPDDPVKGGRARG